MDFQKVKSEVDKIKGTAFIGLDTETEVVLKGGKKNPLQGKVKKVTTGANVMIFAGSDQNGYENMVKRRMLDEGKDPSTFVLGSRAWGTRIPRTPFIEHNTKHYLECIFISPGKSVYLVDGVPTDKFAIEGLPETKEKEEPTGQGKIDNQIILRTFSFDSITAIRIKGIELIE